MSNGKRVDFTRSSSPLPVSLLLDSSVIISALYPNSKPNSSTQKLLSQTKFFWQRLLEAIEKGQCYAFVPQPVINEVFHKLTVFAIEAHLGAGTNAVEQHKRNPQIIQAAGVPLKLQNFLNQLNAVGLEIIQPADIPHDLTTNFEVQLLNYMDKLNLLSTDAHILTIAARLGIMDIASLDKDFLRITSMGFNIYTAAALR